MAQAVHVPRRSSREAIIDAAIVVLSQDPSASLSEVALRAGVGRATLHRHFPSRKDLIAELTLISMREIEKAVAPIRGRAETCSGDLLARLEAIVPLGDRFHYLRSEAWAVAEYSEVVEGYEAELHSLRRLIAGLKQEQAIAEDVPTEWAVSLLDSLVWIAWTSVQAGVVGQREAARLAHRSLLKGLGS